MVYITRKIMTFVQKKLTFLRTLLVANKLVKCISKVGTAKEQNEYILLYKDEFLPENGIQKRI